MQPFTETVVKILKEIPPGYVTTYGQIAKMAGSPRAARQVVRILHTLSEKHNLPWHRIVNSRGEIAIKSLEDATVQRRLLEKENVEFLPDGRVNLSKFQREKEENK
ncbi:MGMT family protein [Paenisporosarcina cavernae]|uniref:MGMT family protein n=1 Tax=Paenisporosarcina cavernae TaxID=2320858 RepID=A0A385YV53_9BACL|nr:MGMT family protein [Paenisporosarcina cavernae]AYC30739.1 MGMT family protein [Paenisporosarcina cavernae]